MCWRVAPGAVALALLLPALAAANPAPRTVERPTGWLALRELPDVLSAPAVRPHLTSGLTTSLVLTVVVKDEARARRRGGARVEVRWEPWDELFHLRARGADGAVESATVAGYEALLSWWRELELAVVPSQGLAGGAPWRVEIELQLVPFSLGEQESAQRWLTESLRLPAADGRPGAGDSGEPLGPVLSLLTATSIRRPVLVTHAWRVHHPPRGGRP